MVAQNHSVDQSALIDKLRNSIRSVETAGRIAGEVRVSSGCAAIDRLLPESGYQRGALVQWLTGGGQAADYLSLLAAKQAAQDGGAIVIFDPYNEFYPPAAAAIGINLDNLIVLKSSQPASRSNQPNARASFGNDELDSDLLWSIDQALRCPAVAAVWGPIGRIGERWFRRFQLSAESSGCIGHFIQPVQQAQQPSWADVQWLVSRSEERELKVGERRSELGERESELGGASLGRSGNRSNRSNKQSGQSKYLSEQAVRLQLTRCRGTQTGKTVNLLINTITGNVQAARRDYETQKNSNRNGSQSSQSQTSRYR